MGGSLYHLTGFVHDHLSVVLDPHVTFLVPLFEVLWISDFFTLLGHDELDVGFDLCKLVISDFNLLVGCQCILDFFLESWVLLFLLRVLLWHRNHCSFLLIVYVCNCREDRVYKTFTYAQIFAFSSAIEKEPQTVLAVDVGFCKHVCHHL